MTDKRSSKTTKLKNFLVTGSVEDKTEDREVAEEEVRSIPSAVEEPQEEKAPEIELPIEDIIEKEEEPPAQGEHHFDTPPPQTAAEIRDLEKEIADLKEMIAGLTAELGRYATTKEQLKEYSAAMNKRDAEIANKKFMVMLEQLSTMREDFFKLCKGINAKLDSFSPKEILGSFEAYGVDMENILVDCGVQIGPSKYEKLNTTNQRIVDVIPTDDESKNGMIAERVSDGYVYQGRVLLKERVKIYRFSEKKEQEMIENEQ